MLTKTILAAAAFATAIAAQPATIANAGSFTVGIGTGNGFIAFGNTSPWHGHGYNHGPRRYDCYEARQELKWDFRRVRRIECNGRIFTFKVKRHRGPWRIVKFNRRTGEYWYV